MTEDNQVAQLRADLASLRTRLRVVTALAMAVLCAVASLGWMRYRDRGPSTVRATRLEIVGGDGRVVGEWSKDALMLRGPTDDCAVRVSANETFAEMSLRKGDKVVHSSASDSVAMFDVLSKERVMLTQVSKDAASTTWQFAGDAPGAAVHVRADETASVDLSRLDRGGAASGTRLALFSQPEVAGVELHLSFADHQGGMALRSSNKSEPMLRVDSDGNRADLVLRDGTLKVAEAPPAPAE